jgi:uncharacterized protein (DUF924 family)
MAASAEFHLPAMCPPARTAQQFKDPVSRMSHDPSPRFVIDFWFRADNRNHWFAPTRVFDERVCDALLGLHVSAKEGQLEGWRNDPEGALALCILFDQAPRNIFRAAAEAYSADEQARAVARHILAHGFDLGYGSDDRRMFAYLPFEHSEDIEDQRLSVRLFNERTSDPELVRHAERHRDIIARFGRFPHRNAALGRVNTADEAGFLKASASP